VLERVASSVCQPYRGDEVPLHDCFYDCAKDGNALLMSTITTVDRMQRN